MDLNKLVARAKDILLTPKTEWPQIATESTTVADLYKGYILPLSALPAIFGALGMMSIGFRSGIGMAVVGYIMGLIGVFIMSLIIDALAPTFGGQKNNVQALKAIAYASTASWVAGVAQIVPFFGWLVALAGGIYSIYLLYLGLPHTMKCPQEKAGGYTAVVIIVAIVLWFITATVVGTVAGVGGGMMRGGAFSSSNDYEFDEDSTLGKMERWAAEMEAASKKLEQAEKSGDQAAQAEALQTMFGAALGGGNVESLAPDRLKAFVPTKLAGLSRSSLSAERNGAMGLQVTQASATYIDDDSGRKVRLEITDAGSAKGLLGLAGWAGLEGEKEADGRYEKTFRKNGRLIHEEWDSNDSRGQYTVVVGDRFTVSVEGAAGSIRDLRAAAEELDLKGLEKLRTEGVKQ